MELPPPSSTPLVRLSPWILRPSFFLSDLLIKQVPFLFLLIAQIPGANGFVLLFHKIFTFNINNQPCVLGQSSNITITQFLIPEPPWLVLFSTLVLLFPRNPPGQLFTSLATRTFGSITYVLTSTFRPPTWNMFGIPVHGINSPVQFN